MTEMLMRNLPVFLYPSLYSWIVSHRRSRCRPPLDLVVPAKAPMHAHISRGRLNSRAGAVQEGTQVRPASVVPANAGIHNHRLEFAALRRDGFLSNNRYHAVWSLAF